MERNGALIRELVLNKSANFYVAGNSKMMPTQVQEALVNAIKEVVPDAEGYVEKMEQTGRYQTETWS